jgi:hypothetical protein
MKVQDLPLCMVLYESISMLILCHSALQSLFSCLTCKAIV